MSSIKYEWEEKESVRGLRFIGGMSVLMGFLATLLIGVSSSLGDFKLAQLGGIVAGGNFIIAFTLVLIASFKSDKLRYTGQFLDKCRKRFHNCVEQEDYEELLDYLMEQATTPIGTQGRYVIRLGFEVSVQRLIHAVEDAIFTIRKINEKKV